MPWHPDWVRIRRERLDLTDWTIHWTRGGSAQEPKSTFENLKDIARDGMLKPTFAVRETMSGNKSRTIQGTEPAVCFSEQPLDAFIRSCAILPDRYRSYAVAVHKWHLHTYGGRPVVYSDEDLLVGLADGEKYRWVRYSPVPTATFTYPVDWMHEREWRSKVRSVDYGYLGQSSAVGIPLLLPPVKYPSSETPILSLPRFLVKSISEQAELREWLSALTAQATTDKILGYYYSTLQQCGIIPLDEVAKLIPSRPEFRRLDTLPLKEIDPSVNLPPPENFV